MTVWKETIRYESVNDRYVVTEESLLWLDDISTAEAFAAAYGNPFSLDGSRASYLDTGVWESLELNAMLRNALRRSFTGMTLLVNYRHPFIFYTGTGVSADELHILQQDDTGALQDNAFELNDYISLLDARIGFTFEEETETLALFDQTSQEEL